MILDNAIQFLSALFEVTATIIFIIGILIFFTNTKPVLKGIKKEIKTIKIRYFNNEL